MRLAAQITYACYEWCVRVFILSWLELLTLGKLSRPSEQEVTYQYYAEIAAGHQPKESLAERLDDRCSSKALWDLKERWLNE